MIAVDTNVLVGAIQTFDPQLRTTARRAEPRRILECLDAAATGNGLGFTPDQAARYVDRFQTFFDLLPETPEIFPTWRKIVLDYKVSGIQVHDARIVAAMMVHQVDQLLSFDLDDFKRYRGITVVHPADVT
jgi:predicted nucleic acid-binding protein